MRALNKIIPWPALGEWRRQMRVEGKVVVVTNGCFDLLHRGHVTYLERARELGDVLLVGVNDDRSVRELKGSGRPLNTASDRAFVLAGLESVSAVSIFGGREATEFLRVAEGDIYVKGGDYRMDTLNSEERAVVEGKGGRIMLIPMVAGKSTTELVKRIGGAAEPGRPRGEAGGF